MQPRASHYWDSAPYKYGYRYVDTPHGVIPTPTLEAALTKAAKDHAIEVLERGPNGWTETTVEYGPCDHIRCEAYDYCQLRDYSQLVDKAAEAVLVDHQRMDNRACLCGWSELGKSHPRHQVSMLREAGVLASCQLRDLDTPPASPPPPQPSAGRSRTP